MNLALMSSPRDMLDAARWYSSVHRTPECAALHRGCVLDCRYFEGSPDTVDRAIILYHKVGGTAGHTLTVVPTIRRLAVLLLCRLARYPVLWSCASRHSSLTPCRVWWGASAAPATQRWCSSVLPSLLSMGSSPRPWNFWSKDRRYPSSCS